MIYSLKTISGSIPKQHKKQNIISFKTTFKVVISSLINVRLWDQNFRQDRLLQNHRFWQHLKEEPRQREERPWKFH